MSCFACSAVAGRAMGLFASSVRYAHSCLYGTLRVPVSHGHPTEVPSAACGRCSSVQGLIDALCLDTAKSPRYTAQSALGIGLPSGRPSQHSIEVMRSKYECAGNQEPLLRYK